MKLSSEDLQRIKTAIDVAVPELPPMEGLLVERVELALGLLLGKVKDLETR